MKRSTAAAAGFLVFVLVLLVSASLGLAGAQSVDLSPVVTVLDTGKGQVASVATAIGLLLSALLAIALVVHLYMKSSGGK